MLIMLCCWPKVEKVRLSLMKITFTLFATQMQKRKYVYITADSKHCFDHSGLVGALHTSMYT